MRRSEPAGWMKLNAYTQRGLRQYALRCGCVQNWNLHNSSASAVQAMKYEYLPAQKTMPTTPTTPRRQTYRKLWPEEAGIRNSSSPVAYKLTESAALRAKRQRAGRMRRAVVLFQVIKRRKMSAQERKERSGTTGCLQSIELNKPYVELKARTYGLRAGMGGVSASLYAARHGRQGAVGGYLINCSTSQVVRRIIAMWRLSTVRCSPYMYVCICMCEWVSEVCLRACRAHAQHAGTTKIRIHSNCDVIKQNQR